MKLYIKERAKEKGVSLKDIASGLGLKSYPSFLRTIENGDNIKISQLLRISEILNCSLDELVHEPVALGSGSSCTCPKCGARLRLTVEDASGEASALKDDKS